MTVRKKYRKIPFWSCGIDATGHYHQEEKFAYRCFARRNRKPEEIYVKRRARNDKIISRFIKLQQYAKVARELEISAGCVTQVMNQAMHICHSKPLCSKWQTDLRIAPDGRYYNQRRALHFATVFLTLDQIRTLAKIWAEKKNSLWLLLESLSDEYQHRDGPPLYRFSNEEIRCLRLPTNQYGKKPTRTD